ncbi:unnamed protein product [Rhizophagus irregularis]|nr:unnamed protein product [Rhizophagus irregularis]
MDSKVLEEFLILLELLMVASHIPIKAPYLFPVNYFNRKGFYSIVLQAVVNHKKSFLDICVGDGGYLNLSWLIVPYKDIDRKLIQKQTYFNQKHNFLSPEEQYHDTGTDVNSETNVNETSEGNAIRNAIYDLLWNNYQRRYLNTNDN